MAAEDPTTSLPLEQIKAPPLPAQRGMAYPWFVVAMCTLCYALAHIDRQILGVLVGPIKAELHLSDTQVGLLAGLAFALCYSIMGLPFGRIADSHSRRNLIVGGVLGWSVMTVLCSVARSFGALFVARVGVGIGEATLSPAATSMIADYVPRDRLATALGIYHMGISLGAGLALLVGGLVVQAVSHQPYVDLPLLGQIASWRVTFVIVGLPGVAIALLMMLLVREPARRNQLLDAQSKVVQLSIREALAQMRLRWRSVLGIGCGTAFIAACNFANMLWAPSLLQRVHHWQPRDVGVALGTCVLIFGCLGVYLGGRLADRWYRNGMTDAHLRVGLLAAVGAAVTLSLACSMTDSRLLLVFMAPAILFVTMPGGATFAAIQLIFPNQLRGSVGAVFVLIITLAGTTLGPLIPALFNDYVFRDELAIGKSLMFSALGFGLASALSFALTLSDYRKQHRLAQQAAHSHS